MKDSTISAGAKKCIDYSLNSSIEQTVRLENYLTYRQLENMFKEFTDREQIYTELEKLAQETDFAFPRPSNGLVFSVDFENKGTYEVIDHIVDIVCKRPEFFIDLLSGIGFGKALTGAEIYNFGYGYLNNLRRRFKENFADRFPNETKTIEGLEYYITTSRYVNDQLQRAVKLVVDERLYKSNNIVDIDSVIVYIAALKEDWNPYNFNYHKQILKNCIIKKMTSAEDSSLWESFSSLRKQDLETVENATDNQLDIAHAALYNTSTNSVAHLGLGLYSSICQQMDDVVELFGIDDNTPFAWTANAILTKEQVLKDIYLMDLIQATTKFANIRVNAARNKFLIDRTGKSACVNDPNSVNTALSDIMIADRATNPTSIYLQSKLTVLKDDQGALGNMSFIRKESDYPGYETSTVEWEYRCEALNNVHAMVRFKPEINDWGTVINKIRKTVKPRDDEKDELLPVLVYRNQVGVNEPDQACAIILLNRILKNVGRIELSSIAGDFDAVSTMARKIGAQHKNFSFLGEGGGY